MMVRGELGDIGSTIVVLFTLGIAIYIAIPTADELQHAWRKARAAVLALFRPRPTPDAAAALARADRILRLYRADFLPADIAADALSDAYELSREKH